MAEPVKAGILSRAAKFAAELLVPDWFGPNEPMTPLAPAEAVEGRQFDFGVGANMQITPKTETSAVRSTTFPHLRWLADNTEILRLIIETRKDKICGMDWDFRIIRDSGKKSEADPRIQWLRKFYRRPDGRNTFKTWLRQLQEDLIVLDAPAIYVRRDPQGRIMAFEQLDGATIKPLMDHLGRVPLAPNAAFQHTLKGMSAVFYSLDDIQYRPRNPRIHSMYGCGPVEQIMVYANMAIRRQIQQLGFFTEGNMPEGIVPIQGTADQVEKFQRIWDAGEINGQKIGRLRFVPADNASKFIELKNPVLADAFDEWMARAACYALSEDPTPFLKQINRATAEQSRDNAQSDGLNVQVAWIKDVLDEQVQDYLGFEDIEAFVVPTKETDPEKVTKRVVALVNAGILDYEQACRIEGIEYRPDAPRAGQQAAALKVEEATQAAARVQRAKVDPIKAASMSRKTADAKIEPTAAAVYDWFQRAADKGAAEILNHLTSTTRSDLGSFVWIESLDLGEAELFDVFAAPLAEIWGASANLALGTVGVDYQIGFLSESLTFARNRAAWLVGKSVDPITGEVFDAIRPQYRISESCRAQIKATTKKAITESWSTEKIAAELRESHAFSRARALSIAGQEFTQADEEGKFAGIQKTGIPMEKSSLLAANENHGPGDIENASQGWIPASQAFQSGHQHPTYHIGCKCLCIYRSARP